MGSCPQGKQGSARREWGGVKVGVGWGGGEEREDETSEERTQGGTSPGIQQWLRLRAPCAGGAGSIPGQGTNPTCRS